MQKKIAETLSAEGASELALRISNYWLREGYIVACRVEQMMVEGTDGRPNHRTSMFVVRSDLIGGLPTRRLMQAA